MAQENNSVDLLGILLRACFLWMIFILLTPPLLHCNNVCPDLCQCRTLSYISCSGRSATDMLQQLGVHTYTLLLDKIYLDSNQLETLHPTMFRSLTKLQRLRIYHNELVLLERGIFDQLVNLQSLNLHHNQINHLPPQVFWSLGNLTELTLSSNHLQYVPSKSFYNMPELKKLTIYSNPLLSLPDELMGHMPHITQFYLNNRLKYLHPDLFHMLTKMNILFGNPWDCDCAIRGLTRWLKQNVHVDEFSYCDEKRATTILQTQTDSYKETETSHYTSVNPFEKSTPLETTTYSKYFYDILVVQQGPAYVHHKIHKGWVSVWFLPSGSALVGSIMFCYILLLAMGLALVLAAIYSMHRLNTAVDKLKAKCAHGEEHVMLSGLVHT
uniref:LRRCT domain-containing protein n=1 Tax=Cyprinodon variegatus TaxID=28743 RepID=A0A3Q2DDY6_CYPVA